jgi:hypothetical protein
MLRVVTDEGIVWLGIHTLGVMGKYYVPPSAGRAELYTNQMASRVSWSSSVVGVGLRS